ncbi:SMI1/KNR4 family protein [Streptomyces sp. NPDC056039]|uniref:SMI1/KNR4 family protein n=1 Tax=Streptomyces sp. NPDC056039 TaxID=3345687 RepID=UPI0035E0DFFB
MSVEESWDKIEQWIFRHAPDELALPGPCTPSRIQQLRDQLGVRLPEDVERSLLRHDGSGTTTIIPPGFTLLNTEEILKKRASWLRFAMTDDSNLSETDKPFIIPIAALSTNMLLVDTRTGKLGWWDIESPYSSAAQLPGATLSSVLDFVGNLLASPRPWIAILPGDEEWEATEAHPDLPRTLCWTEDELPAPQ